VFGWWTDWTAPTWQKITIISLIVLILIVTLANVIGAITLGAKNRRARAAAKAAAKAALVDKKVIVNPGWRIVVRRKAAAAAAGGTYVDGNSVMRSESASYASSPTVVYPQRVNSRYEADDEQEEDEEEPATFEEFDDRTTYIDESEEPEEEEAGVYGEPVYEKPAFDYEPAEAEPLESEEDDEDDREYAADVEKGEPAFGGAEYSVETEHRPTPEEERLTAELDRLNERLAMLTERLEGLEKSEENKPTADETEVYEEPEIYEEPERPAETADEYDPETDDVEAVESASNGEQAEAKDETESVEEENAELEKEAVAGGSTLPKEYEDMDEPEEPLAIEDEDGEVTEVVKRVDYKSRIAVVVRYRKSFTAKLIQCSDETKSWYTALKNEFLSYKKVKSRVSWKYDSINLGRVALAKFAIRGKTLCVYFALDPKEFAGSRYKVESDESRRFEEVPCMYRIKNRKRAKYAMQLFALLAERNNLKKADETPKNDYYLPYEHSVELIGRNLIKEVYSRESLDDFLQKRENSIKTNAAKARRKEVYDADDDDEEETG
jgi:hypothetical protein